jgi:hypothetical protein
MAEAVDDPPSLVGAPFPLGLDERVLEEVGGRAEVRGRERPQRAQVATVSVPSSSEIATSIE